MTQVQGAVALVTGANRGIGRSLVRALTQAGCAKVYASARKLETLKNVIDGSNGRVVPLELDVTDEASVVRAAETARDVTLLINNAGVLDFGSVLEAPTAAFERNFDVNFFGPLRTTRAFAAVLARNPGGAVVNVLTLVALASMPGLGVYNASKAAAWSMTQSIRADLRKRGVKVFGVFPAGVDTDMLKGVETTKANPDDVARAIVAGINAGQEDIFPDAVSSSVYTAWKADHKAVEGHFASM